MYYPGSRRHRGTLRRSKILIEILRDHLAVRHKLIFNFRKTKILRSDITCERHSFNSISEFFHSTRIYCMHFAASLHSDRSNSENANGSFDENLNISSEMNQHKQCVLRTWHSLFCTYYKLIILENIFSL